MKDYFNENEIQDFGTNDPVLLQGPLYRFKPGIENNFISRWVQISGRAFRYFRNQYQSMGLHRPVMAVPKTAVEDVQKIRVHKASYFKMKHLKEHEKVLFKYMFEVYLREDYEDVF